MQQLCRHPLFQVSTHDSRTTSTTLHTCNRCCRKQSKMIISCIHAAQGPFSSNSNTNRDGLGGHNKSIRFRTSWPKQTTLKNTHLAAEAALSRSVALPNTTYLFSRRRLVSSSAARHCLNSQETLAHGWSVNPSRPFTPATRE